MALLGPIARPCCVDLPRHISVRCCSLAFREGPEEGSLYAYDENGSYRRARGDRRGMRQGVTCCAELPLRGRHIGAHDAGAITGSHRRELEHYGRCVARRQGELPDHGPGETE